MIQSKNNKAADFIGKDWKVEWMSYYLSVHWGQIVQQSSFWNGNEQQSYYSTFRIIHLLQNNTRCIYVSIILFVCSSFLIMMKQHCQGVAKVPKFICFNLRDVAWLPSNQEQYMCKTYKIKKWLDVLLLENLQQGVYVTTRNCKVESPLSWRLFYVGKLRGSSLPLTGTKRGHWRLL